MNVDVDTITIFYINAQEDEAFRENLQKQLLQKKYQIPTDHWSEQDIPVGSIMENEYKAYACKADFLFLLISSDFPGISPIIRSIVLERWQAKHLRIIPIYLRPVVKWDDPDFSGLVSLPSDGKAISLHINQDSIFKDIAQEIIDEAETILKERYRKLAETYRADKKYAESLRACQRAISFAQKSDASLYQFQGDLYTQNEQLEEALEAYERAIGLKTSATLWEKKGLTLFALGNHEAAVRAYQEGLQSAPSTASLSRNLGDAFYALQQFEEARRAYKQASAQDSQNAYLRARIGDTFLETPDVEQSLSWYNQAIALQSTNDSFGASVKASFYEKKGDVLMRITNYKDASDAYGQASKLNDENADYFINQARALESLGTRQADRASFEKAVKAYEHALRLYPENLPILLTELGDVLFKLQRLEEAFGAYEEAIRCQPDFGLAYLGKGNVLRQQANDLEKLAQEAYNQAESLGISREYFSQE